MTTAIKIRAHRWSDNDTYFGPFTFARDRNYHAWAVCLSSTDDEDRGCNLRFSGFGRTAIVALPSWLLRPERKKVFPSWDSDTIQRLGRDWYWDITPREFGFSIFEGHMSVSYGRRTHDSSTEQRWGCFLPWTQWRHVRHSLYGLDGKIFADLNQRIRWGSWQYEINQIVEDACPTVSFRFKDFDGEELTAKTKIEEREWLFGTGWCKWLSLFRQPKVRRSLDLRFSGETGDRKGSWKGGTIGTGIDMLPDELHENAFRRYCAENNMTFVATDSNRG